MASKYDFEKPVLNWPATLDHYRIELLPHAAIVLTKAQTHEVSCLLARHEREIPTHGSQNTPSGVGSEGGKGGGAPVAVAGGMTIKTCGCGREYNQTAWLALVFVGLQADEVETLEIRNCPCGSSIAVVLLPDGRRTT